MDHGTSTDANGDWSGDGVGGYADQAGLWTIKARLGGDVAVTTIRIGGRARMVADGDALLAPEATRRLIADIARTRTRHPLAAHSAPALTAREREGMILGLDVHSGHTDSCAAVSCAPRVPAVRNDSAMTPARTMNPATTHRPVRKLPVRPCSQPVR